MTQSIEERRTQAVLQIRLDGAERWDIAAFIEEKEQAGEDPWTVAAGESPMTPAQIGTIIIIADAIIAAAYPDDAPELAMHKAKLKSLYARAVSAGEIATAARILKEIRQLDCVDQPKPASAIDETRALLLLEIKRRHLEIADEDDTDRRGWDREMEHGPAWSVSEWFNISGDNAARMRYSRALARLIEAGHVIENGRHLRLSEAGEAIIEALAQDADEE